MHTAQIIYPGTANLAQAWLAVVRANSGEGEFLKGYFKRK
jgi:hypothetical protein